MTVVDVWAEVNGQTCRCSCSGGNSWNLTAPSDCPDGCYTCGFWATDEAGNVAYKTAMLWVFDGALTCLKWIEDKYRVNYLNHEYTVMVKERSDYSSMVMESLYSSHVLADKYHCHYVKRRCMT